MPNNRKRLQGRVISDKMDKTITVAIERRSMHRVYKKIVTTTKKVMAHDENNEVPVGALVRLVESRPLSKNKRWVVEAILEAPGVPVVEPTDTAAVITPVDGAPVTPEEPADTATEESTEEPADTAPESTEEES